MRNRPGTVVHEATRAFPGAESTIPPATRRRYWSRALIDRGTANRPRFGDTRWLCLPDDHPDKLAAAIVAAEMWAEDGDNLEANLRHEIERGRATVLQAIKEHEDATYRAEQNGWREYAKGLQSTRPSFVQRRKAQLEAAQPRPGDFPGRGGAGA